MWWIWIEAETATVFVRECCCEPRLSHMQGTRPLFTPAAVEAYLNLWISFLSCSTRHHVWNNNSCYDCIMPPWTAVNQWQPQTTRLIQSQEGVKVVLNYCQHYVLQYQHLKFFILLTPLHFCLHYLLVYSMVWPLSTWFNHFTMLLTYSVIVFLVLCVSLLCMYK